jgi:dTDP-glucose 4,6-dehydratase
VPGHDAVINFAAETHVDRSISGAAPFVAANVAGVQVLLQACLDAGVGPVVQVSTDEVYGSIASGSWTEQAPLAPNSPYSAAKAGGDLIAGPTPAPTGWTCGSPAAATTTAPTSTRRRSSRCS